MKKFFKDTFYFSRKFKDNIFIIKLGGQLLANKKAMESICNDIAKLQQEGIKIIIVYGAGVQIDKQIESENRTTKKIAGRRITSIKDIESIKKVLGKLGIDILCQMMKSKANAILMPLINENIIVQKRKKVKGVDFGFVGDIKEIKSAFIKKLLKTDNVLIVPSISAINDSQIVNINADTIATELALCLKADKLILLTQTSGVLKDKKTISLLTDKSIPKLIKDKVVDKGMQVKLENCLKAVVSGVKRTHILNGLKDGCLTKEIYTNAGDGTMIILEKEKDNYISEQKILNEK